MGQYLYPKFRRSSYFDPINKWWKTRYPAYKIRIVSKKEFELVKMQAEKKEQ